MHCRYILWGLLFLRLRKRPPEEATLRLLGLKKRTPEEATLGQCNLSFPFDCNETCAKKTFMPRIMHQTTRRVLRCRQKAMGKTKGHEDTKCGLRAGSIIKRAIAPSGRKCDELLTIPINKGNASVRLCFLNRKCKSRDWTTV